MQLVYPVDWDVLWIACDAKGSVGAFLTGGRGPIPTAFLRGDRELGEVEEEITRLPSRGGYRLLITVPRPDDLIALAERGLYVYDWQDVHRSTAHATHRYERVALPAKPVRIKDLRRVPREMAGLVKLKLSDFRYDDAIDVSSMVYCCESETV